jgi:hypothetical protein
VAAVTTHVMANVRFARADMGWFSIFFVEKKRSDVIASLASYNVGCSANVERTVLLQKQAQGNY